MKHKRSRPRRIFDYSIIIGGIALLAFAAHSVFIGMAVFPFGISEEKKEMIGVISVVTNYILGSVMCLAFATMIGCGLYCAYTGEMELTLGD